MSTEDIPESEALFGHLTKVLLKIVKDRPQDSFATFESLSAAVKQDVPSEQEAVDKTTSEEIAALITQQVAAHQQALDLIKEPKKTKRR